MPCAAPGISKPFQLNTKADAEDRSAIEIEALKIIKNKNWLNNQLEIIKVEKNINFSITDNLLVIVLEKTITENKINGIR